MRKKVYENEAQTLFLKFFFLGPIPRGHTLVMYTTVLVLIRAFFEEFLIL